MPHTKTGKIIAQTPRKGETILEQGGVAIIVGSKHRPYFMVPETKNIDIDDLFEEMDARKIRYKVDYAKNKHGTTKTDFKTSALPRTIFSNENELVIQINPGG